MTLPVFRRSDIWPGHHTIFKKEQHEQRCGFRCGHYWCGAFRVRVGGLVAPAGVPGLRDRAHAFPPFRHRGKPAALQHGHPGRGRSGARRSGAAGVPVQERCGLHVGRALHLVRLYRQVQQGPRHHLPGAACRVRQDPDRRGRAPWRDRPLRTERDRLRGSRGRIRRAPCTSQDRGARRGLHPAGPLRAGCQRLWSRAAPSAGAGKALRAVAAQGHLHAYR